MIGTLLLLRVFPFLCGGHRQLALENLALRQQLAMDKRTASRPKLRHSERLFWVCLSRVWAGWRTALVIVTPATVLSVAKTPAGGQEVDLSAPIRRQSRVMRAASNGPFQRPLQPHRRKPRGR